MTRESTLVGLVALLFGLGAYYATGELAAFSAANLALAALALLAALASGARRLGRLGGPYARRIAARGALRVAGALALGVALERGAALVEMRFDWTFERRFELSPATRKALAEISGQPLEAILFSDPLDPRRRQTRLLLESLAREGDVRVRELALDAAEEEADRYAVAGSNGVVLVLGDRFETLDRPTEGAIYEALYRLRARRTGRLLFLTGEGEGDLERTDALGYSGLAAALETEGYEIRTAASAALRTVPPDVDAVVALAPRRGLLPGAIEALRAYLGAGGRLVALLEPGAHSGLEELLAEFGMRSPDALVVDPASAPLEGAGAISPLVHHYESHPATRGLDSTRMAILHGARAFELTKPQAEDRVQRTALSSPRAWLSPDLGLLAARSVPPEPDSAARGYQTLAAVGLYPREGGEARIAAFGDADFASNRFLRALYNLDLLLNAVHWATAQEPEITLRPKVRTPLNFPVPLTNTIQALYGVGLVVPELLLVAGGLVWLRRRAA